MVARRRAGPDLWLRSPLPPFLLAVNGSHLDLPSDWDCDGAGREQMSAAESQVLRRSGFDPKAFRELGLGHSAAGNVRPYLATCAAGAKLLHYSGAQKPWMLEALGKPSPVCALPTMFAWRRRWESRKDVKVFCETASFVSCGEIWSHFLDEGAACALKDFDKEWQVDEEAFVARQAEEEWERRRRDLEAEAEAKARADAEAAKAQAQADAEAAQTRRRHANRQG